MAGTAHAPGIPTSETLVTSLEHVLAGGGQSNDPAGEYLRERVAHLQTIPAEGKLRACDRIVRDLLDLKRDIDEGVQLFFHEARSLLGEAVPEFAERWRRWQDDDEGGEELDDHMRRFFTESYRGAEVKQSGRGATAVKRATQLWGKERMEAYMFGNGETTEFLVRLGKVAGLGVPWDVACPLLNHLFVRRLNGGGMEKEEAVHQVTATDLADLAEWYKCWKDNKSFAKRRQGRRKAEELDPTQRCRVPSGFFVSQHGLLSAAVRPVGPCTVSSPLALKNWTDYGGASDANHVQTQTLREGTQGQLPATATAPGIEVDEAFQSAAAPLRSDARQAPVVLNTPVTGKSSASVTLRVVAHHDGPAQNDNSVPSSGNEEAGVSMGYPPAQHEPCSPRRSERAPTSEGAALRVEMGDREDGMAADSASSSVAGGVSSEDEIAYDTDTVVTAPTPNPKAAYVESENSDDAGASDDEITVASRSGELPVRITSPRLLRLVSRTGTGAASDIDMEDVLPVEHRVGDTGADGLGHGQEVQDDVEEELHDEEASGEDPDTDEEPLGNDGGELDETGDQPLLESNQGARLLVQRPRRQTVSIDAPVYVEVPAQRRSKRPRRGSSIDGNPSPTKRSHPGVAGVASESPPNLRCSPLRLQVWEHNGPKLVAFLMVMRKTVAERRGTDLCLQKWERLLEQKPLLESGDAAQQAVYYLPAMATLHPEYPGLPKGTRALPEGEDQIRGPDDISFCNVLCVTKEQVLELKIAGQKLPVINSTRIFGPDEGSYDFKALAAQSDIALATVPRLYPGEEGKHIYMEAQDYRLDGNLTRYYPLKQFLSLTDKRALRGEKWDSQSEPYHRGRIPKNFLNLSGSRLPGVVVPDVVCHLGMDLLGVTQRRYEQRVHDIKHLGKDYDQPALRVDVGACGAFQLVGEPGSLSDWHVDVMVGTWIKVLFGHKLWVVIDGRLKCLDEFQDPQAFAPAPDMIKFWPLAPGDSYIMNPGRFNPHMAASYGAPFTHIVGGQVWSQDRRYLKGMTELLAFVVEHNALVTNEDVPRSLPAILDQLILDIRRSCEAKDDHKDTVQFMPIDLDRVVRLKERVRDLIACSCEAEETTCKDNNDCSCRVARPDDPHPCTSWCHAAANFDEITGECGAQLLV